MNSSATFGFYTEKEAVVCIEIFSMQGEKVAVPLREKLTQGAHTIAWEGKSTRGEKLSPGIYLYRVSIGDDKVKSGKLSILY